MYAMLKTTSSGLSVAMVFGLLLFGAPLARADVTYTVTLDTSVLAANSADAPFAIDFQMNDGSSGDGVGNNTAMISNFAITGGSLIAGTVTSSAVGVTGDLNPSDTLSLNDASFLVEFNQQFNPGSAITFSLDLSTNVSLTEGAGAPDQFSFTVYSDNLAETSANLSIDITGNPPSIVADTGGTVSGVTQPNAPVVVQLVTTPEPSSCVLLAMGLVGLVATGRRRGKVPTAQISA